ncbi:methylated-DNA--[protein]-cysteine S-methyltransferase [Altererythrobacter lauratis]|uniref:Bifunctional transcriptional activator/DNA repair enzyme AdaA n=1 Tax=Alteraurantiacibacter lauratis TaxID=2054627 RepID=A0ABV7EH13_9SPHN
MTNPDEQQLAYRIARLLDGEGRAPTLDALGRATGLSPFQVQRLFLRVTGLSPAAFARALREERAVHALAQGGRITDAIYDAGFESAGRFYAAMRQRLGMTPSAWQRGGAGVRIGWAVEQTTLGPMLLAVSDKGICRLSFHESGDDLPRHFPQADLAQGAVPAALMDNVVARVENPSIGANGLAIDTGGTPFQQRVWAQLRAIPPGETRSYAEIAVAIGQPGAARAVGGANGANPVAVLIPCHRVIAADGALGGYAWGEAIKRELLWRERKA